MNIDFFSWNYTNCLVIQHTVLIMKSLSNYRDEIYKNIWLHRHASRPSQDSSLWIGLANSEHLIPSESSKHRVLSFAKMLAVWWTNKKYSVLISVFQSAQWINSERIYSIYVYNEITFVFVSALKSVPLEIIGWFFPQDLANFSASDKPGVQFPSVSESTEKINRAGHEQDKKCHTSFFAFQN